MKGKTLCEEIRIYVAGLAAYNNGKFHGVWIDATDELEDIQGQINKILVDSPESFAKEYAIHDLAPLNVKGSNVKLGSQISRAYKG